MNVHDRRAGIDPDVAFVFEEAERQNVSLLELSKRTGISRGTFQFWRRGHSSPTYAVLKATYAALGHKLGRIA